MTSRASNEQLFFVDFTCDVCGQIVSQFGTDFKRFNTKKKLLQNAITGAPK